MKHTDVGGVILLEPENDADVRELMGMDDIDRGYERRRAVREAHTLRMAA